MVQTTNFETERKIVSILKVLSESTESLGSITIARELERHGIFLSERAVRYHLRITDERGYTQPMGRDGRMLTAEGLEELKMALAPEQVGFIREKLELLAFQTTFDPKTRTGQIPIKTSFIDKDDFKKALVAMSDAFRTGKGKILANFREIPAPSRSLANEVINLLQEAGISGVYALGNTSEPICQIPIGLDRAGMVSRGGLNPVAAAVESGIEVDNIAESGMVGFEQLTSFWQL